MFINEPAAKQGHYSNTYPKEKKGWVFSEAKRGRKSAARIFCLLFYSLGSQ